MKETVFLTFAILMIAAVSAKAQVKTTTPAAVGTIAPDFTLSDSAGKRVTLSKVRQPTVLVFYRGYW